MKQDTIERILDLFQERGAEEYHGEAVNQTEHAIQAALLALFETGDRELAVAALLHDIGHLLAGSDDADMDGYGALKHEALGAQYLEELGFSEEVVRLVGGHVAAKRYLAYTEPGYYDQLSDASKATLQFQGGPMSEAEALRFRRDSLFEQHIRLRRMDERAKVPGMNLPEMDTFETMLREYLYA